MAALRHLVLVQTLFTQHAKALATPETEAYTRQSVHVTSSLSRHGFPLCWMRTSPKAILKTSPVTTGGDVALDSEVCVSYTKLRDLLAAGEWQLADEETRRLVIVLAGENAIKRKYVFFSEVQFIPATDLCTIDSLWREYSNGKFGYSVQRKIMKIVDEDCTAFFKKVGWMKPLGSDSLQYTYRSFPSEFMWKINDSVPEGHLPLTNALRGTQLLKSLLAHPAFAFVDENMQAPVPSLELSKGDLSRQQTEVQVPKKPLSVNYSF